MTADDEQKLGALITRAWTDPAFKSRLLADGNTALAEMGAVVAPGVTVKVLEDTSAVVHLVLPMTQAAAELTDNGLDGVAGGMANPWGDGENQRPWSEYEATKITFPG